jgi:hypothetical protein
MKARAGKSRLIGYAPVSTDEQTAQIQEMTLPAAGCVNEEHAADEASPLTEHKPSPLPWPANDPRGGTRLGRVRSFIIARTIDGFGSSGTSSKTWIRHTQAATAMIRTQYPFPLKSLPKS